MTDNKQNRSEKKKNVGTIVSSILLTISALCCLAGAGCFGYFLGRASAQREQTKVQDSEPVAEIESSDGITVQARYYAANPASTDAYGYYEITYKVDPVIFTDEIEAKLQYADGTDVPTDVLSFDHDAANTKITVHCKKVFTQAAILTLYAKSDPSVKRTIRFDFREKLTVTLPDSIALTEGAVPTIDPVITSTGGTLQIDKTVTNQVYSWNPAFIQWVNTETKAAMDAEIQDISFNCSTSQEKVGDLVGLSQSDCDSFFKNAFSSNDFLTTKGQKYSYEWEYSDDDSGDPNVQNTTWYLGKAPRADFLKEFDGKSPIIDFSCYINGTKYEKTFGLSLSAIPVKGISTDVSSYVF